MVMASNFGMVPINLGNQVTTFLFSEISKNFVKIQEMLFLEIEKNILSIELKTYYALGNGSFPTRQGKWIRLWKVLIYLSQSFCHIDVCRFTVRGSSMWGNFSK